MVAPAKKYAARVNSIREVKLPLRLEVPRNKHYALAVVGYVAESALPPKVFELSCLRL